MLPMLDREARAEPKPNRTREDETLRVCQVSRRAWSLNLAVGGDQNAGTRQMINI